MIQRCLGLDISRYSTGWCIIDTLIINEVSTNNDIINNKNEYRENMKIIDYGYIDSSKIKEEGKTLIFLEEKITNIIEQYLPNIIIIEQQYVGKNAQTGLVLAGIHAIVKLIAAKKDINIIYYPILTMKSITLNGIKLKKSDGTRKTGKEIKLEVKDTIFKLFDNVQFKNITDDVTDAISAVITYVRLKGKPKGKQSADRKSNLGKKKILKK